MNPSTDRIAFIALLFLIVIVAVAAFWDDGDPVDARIRAGDDQRVIVTFIGGGDLQISLGHATPVVAIPALDVIAIQCGDVHLGPLDAQLVAREFKLGLLEPVGRDDEDLGSVG